MSFLGGWISACLFCCREVSDAVDVNENSENTEVSLKRSTSKTMGYTERKDVTTLSVESYSAYLKAIRNVHFNLKMAKEIKGGDIEVDIALNLISNLIHSSFGKNE